MKTLNYLAVLTGLLFLPSILYAQISAGTISLGASQLTQSDSVVSLTAEAEGLPQIDLADLPPDGSYWLVTSNGILAPLPAPLFDPSFPIFAITDNILLVDGTGGLVNPQSLDGMQIMTDAADTSAEDALGNAVADLIEQVQEKQMLWETAAMLGIDMSMLDDDSEMNSSALYSFDETQLWLEITNIAGGTVFANLHNATNQIYAIYSSINLASGWQVETEVWPTNTDCHPFTVATQDRDTLFLKAEDWSTKDSNGDGVPDWWAWQYFGNVNVNATNLDFSSGYSFDYDYSNTIPPVVYQFSGIQVSSQYVNSNSTTVQLNLAGFPYYVAVLVDSEDFSNAVWNTLSGSNVTVNLETEGWHDVWIGVRGHGDDPNRATWQWKRLNRDTTPPAIVITGPTNNTVDVPLIQLTGYSPETLASISYDLSNTNGLWTNQPVTPLEKYFDTNIWDFTTNTFQAFDVPLAGGTNTFTIHATDLSGNVTTTNFNFTVDFSNKTAPNVQLTWPQDGVKISGNSVTLQGQLDDPTATVYASITDNNGNTSIATGLVERDGRFWLENLPLNGGTNVVSVTVSNIVGQTTVTNISVVQHNLYLTLNPPYDSSQLWQPMVNVSGAISSSGYLVWVNGVQADVNGSYWSAANVPVAPGGVAVFNVTAYPPGEIPLVNTNGLNAQTPGAVNLYVEMDKPARLYVAKYSKVEIANSDDAYAWVYNAEGNLVDWDYRYDDHTTILDWADEAGGLETKTESDGKLGTIWAIENYVAAYQESDMWPASVWPKATNGVQCYSNYVYEYSDNQTYVSVRTNSCNFPDLQLEQCYLKASLNASQTTPVSYGGKVVRQHRLTFFRKAETVMELQIGGKSGQMTLVEFTASALDGWLMLTPWWETDLGYFYFTTDTPIDPTLIEVNGEALDSSGKLYAAIPNNTKKVVTPAVKNKDYYSHNLGAQNYNLVSWTHYPALSNANRNRTTIGVGEEVDLSGMPGNTTWSASAGGLSATNGSFITFTAPSNTPLGGMTAMVVATVGNASLAIPFKILPPSGIDHATITGTNSFPLNIAGAGMTNTAWITPTSVSFYRVNVMEVGEDATNIWGYYSQWTPQQLHHNPNPNWVRLTSENWFIDNAAFPSGGLTNWAAGGYEWNIPIRWQVDGSRVTNSMLGCDQVFSIDTNGTARVTKYGNWIQRTTNNVITKN